MHRQLLTEQGQEPSVHCERAGVEDGVGPLTPAQVANQATLAARKHVERYYDACLRSDDELHPTQTRDVSLRSAGICLHRERLHSSVQRGMIVATVSARC